MPNDLLKIAGLVVFSWTGGLAIHVIALLFLYGLVILPGDLLVVAIESAIVFGGGVLVIVPSLLALRRVGGPSGSPAVLGLAGAAWFPLLTAVLFLRFGGFEAFRWEDLLGYEARVYHLQFAASGLFLGATLAAVPAQLNESAGPSTKGS